MSNLFDFVFFYAHLLISFASWLIHIYPKRLLKRPFFLVVVAGVVVVVFAALGGCTRPAEVFGVVPAPAPLKVENIYSVQNILNKMIFVL